MFDAIDPLKFARHQALKQMPSRIASPAPAMEATPKARLQTGPSTDVFTGSAKTASEIKTPATVNKPEPASLKGFNSLKPSAAAFLQSLKEIMPNRNHPVRTEKVTKPEFSTQQAAALKTPASANVESAKASVAPDNPFGKAAEKAAVASAKPATNQFSAINEKLQKKNISALGAALPLASIGLLAIPVAAPATLIAKPSLINQIVAALPVTLP